MGRKRAPEPLALADPHAQSSVSLSPNGSGQFDGNNSINNSAASPVSLPSPVAESTLLGVPRSPQVAVSPGNSDAGLQVLPTPTSSKSPRSPRSPFSKFNINNSKKSGTQQAQPHSPLSSQSQSESHSSQSKSEPLNATQLPPPQRHQQPPQSNDQAQQQQQPAENKSYSPYQQQEYPQQNPKETKLDYPSQLRSVYNTTTPKSTKSAAPHDDTAGQPRYTHDREPDEKHSRSGSRFFNFNKASKSTHQLHQHQSQGQSLSQNPTDNNSGVTMSRGTDYPATSDRVSSKTSKYSDASSADHSTQKAVSSLPSKSDLSLASGGGENDTSNTLKKGKPKPFGILSRTRSIKDKDGPSPREKEASVPVIQEPERAQTFATQPPLKTAPLQSEGHDRSFRHMMNSTVRNHSADRAVPRDISANKENRPHRDQQVHTRSHPSSFKDNNGGSAFFSGLKSSGTRAADMISKGLFGKSGRSGSTSERDHIVDDEHYQLKVINLPLVEQTRLTRISKRLEDSRDKTEFWMPAFPWRAIDYLNYKGSDVEGLYRVPGSGPQIKKWQRKFDEEHDVDLFNQDDLYDINIIGSMLKAWLRELPDELFPKAAQDRIARECAGAEEVPQLLIDELSNLSPYNYYLLFAITCHLSLLLAHSDKNKMDFRNLCICFQPCMKIDAFCFRFLVCDWRLCWQGCKNESKFIEEEYQMFEQPPPRAFGSRSGSRSPSDETHDERNVSSSDSGKPPLPSREPQPQQQPLQQQPPQVAQQPPQQQQAQQQAQQNGKLRKKPLPSGQTNGSLGSNNSTVSTSLTVSSDRETPSKRSTELRPLSPIKPLSPLGF